jgi:hypothetical protein
MLIATTVFSILSWWFIPEENWLPKEKIVQAFNTADEEPIG